MFKYMKKTLILLSFITVSLFGHCDTLDYYHVYLNDSLIGKYNFSLSDKPLIVLKKSELNDDDVITVKYGTEHLCVECVYVLSVLIEVKEKAPEAQTTESFGKLSILIEDLIYFQKKYEIEKYHFNYGIRFKNSPHDYGGYLLELKIV